MWQWKLHWCLNGKMITINGRCSIAMFDYQRVYQIGMGQVPSDHNQIVGRWTFLPGSDDGPVRINPSPSSTSCCY